MLWRGSRDHPSPQSPLAQPMCPTVLRITSTKLPLLLTAFDCSWALTTSCMCKALFSPGHKMVKPYGLGSL